MSTSRRAFLQTTSSGFAAWLLAAGGSVIPRWLPAAATSPLAAGDNRSQFEALTLDDVVKQLGGTHAQESADVGLKAPEIAENGAVVPVEVSSTLPGTKLIAVVSEKNPHALSALFHISEGTDAFVSTRVKVAETSKVFALVQTDKGFFFAHREVKVTLGGCGG